MIALSYLFISAIGLLTSISQAENCEFTKFDSAEVSSENFQIKSAKVEILFLSTFFSKPTQRQAAYKIFFDEAISTSDLVTRVDPLFANDKEALTNLSSTELYLEDRLIEDQIGFILIALPVDEFREMNRAARALQLLEFELRVKQNPDLLDHLRKLILDTVGVGPYLNSHNSDLFKGVEYDSYSFDDPPRKKKSENRSAPARASRSTSSAARVDERYHELLDEFRRNPQTRAMFIRYAQKVRGNTYDGWSKSEIEDDVNRHFWRQARPKISSWITLVMNEKKRKEVSEPAPSPSPSANESPSNENSSLTPKLFERSGQGVVLVPQDRLKALESRFKKQCQNKK